MKVLVHDYTQAAKALSLLGRAYRFATSQREPPPAELRDLLEQAMTALDSYLAADNLTEADSDEVYNGLVPYNEIKHLFCNNRKTDNNNANPEC